MGPKPKARASTGVADRPLLQWGMAVLGGIVTLSVIGVVLWEAVQLPSPPDLQARIVEVRAAAGGYVAQVEVVNAGADTAAAVDLMGRLGDSPPSTATVDYVPGHGRATAWLRFDGDPRGATVEVIGWSEP